MEENCRCAAEWVSPASEFSAGSATRLHFGLTAADGYRIRGCSEKLAEMPVACDLQLSQDAITVDHTTFYVVSRQCLCCARAVPTDMQIGWPA